MPEKLLVQSKASPSDPSFDDIEICGNKFKNYFRNGGIKVLEKELVISCHGNTELDLSVVKDIQNLADAGHKVVSIQQGGLYFAKPSIEAANMPTVPVISVPLDGGLFGGLDAFLAPHVPSGVAVIGGVGVDDYFAAFRTAENILTQEFAGVRVLSPYNPSEKLIKKLGEFNIKILGYSYEKINEPHVNLMEINLRIFDKFDKRFNEEIECSLSNPTIYTLAVSRGYETKNTDNEKTVLDWINFCQYFHNGVYVRGEENLAFFAAKIFSSYNKRAFDALKEAARKKAASYEERRITLEDFV